LIAKSSALSTFDLASACLGAVRRRAGGSQADGSSLPRARCGRRLAAIWRMSVKGTEHLGGFKGHGPKSVGAVCDPSVFTGVVELPPGLLGPRDGVVLVDLVEPGCDPITWSGDMIRQKTFDDAVPWLVIRIFGTPAPDS
jgi:hypothetical protein